MDDLDLISKKNILEANKTFFSRGSSSSGNDFIRRALETLKSDDEMIILNCLCDLSSELSMANDNVAEDVNCQILIRELIILFDKFYMLPDIPSKIINLINIFSVLFNMFKLFIRY
jgi:hypothetical protein